MTSTNVNFGVPSDSRNSSRVLKPPGGGHSDIFGQYDKQEQKRHVRYNQPKSTINEVFSFDDLGNKKKEVNKNSTENDKTDHDSTENETNGVNGNENEVPKLPVTPQRARVPPGGFSSGLW